MVLEELNKEKELKVIAGGGCHDCGGRCPYSIYVRDGKALRIEPHEELKACVRGYGYIKRVYSPDRLKYPMKRAGARGEGHFQRISWEEALETVVKSLKTIKETYGPEAILCQGSSGSPGRLQNPAPIYRLFNMLGGCVYRWGSASAEGAYFAGRVTFGTHATGHTKDDLIHSNLIILWGLNTTENIWGTNTSLHLLRAKEKGTRMIYIDPRFTNTAAVFADRWIPIRPGTDTAMTGNIGIPGGSPGCCDIPTVGVSPGPNMPSAPSLIPIGENPLEMGKNSEGNPLSFSFKSWHKVHNAKLWDSILMGKKGGYPGDFRFLYVVCANPLNQIPNTNKGVKALHHLDFIVVQDHFINSTARFADIVLPATTHWERDDYMRPWLGGDYHLFGSKAIESVGEAKSDYRIALELADHLGIEDFSDKTEEEWVRQIVFSSSDSRRDIEGYDKFRSQGIAKAKVKKPVITFEDQIRDPSRFPFSTPSGKIEIYSKDLADLNDPHLPPIPKHIEPWEGPRDPLTKKFPLQLITFHFKTRAHSNFHNIDWLRELESHEIWMNPIDAEKRGIENGQKVRAFNDRGEVWIHAKVTERIMPGVVAIGQGAWYFPDEKGIDRGGCANVLTRDEGGAGGSTPTNTALVEVTRCEH